MSAVGPTVLTGRPVRGSCTIGVPIAIPVCVSFWLSLLSRARAGDAEVGDQRVPVGHHHVFGLDVAMDDALRVRVAERVGDFERDLDRVVDRELLLAIEPVADATRPRRTA